MNVTRWTAIAVATVLVSAVATAAHARSCESEAGRVISAQGLVHVKGAGGGQWQRAARRTPLCQGDTIRTGRYSRAAVRLVNRSIMRIDQRTETQFERVETEAAATSVFRLFTGLVQSFSRKPRKSRIATAAATLGIRGTEFVLGARDGTTELTVFEGEVEAVNDAGRAILGPGQGVTVSTGTAPVARTVVSPRDQVQWALHYPPVLAIGERSGALGEVTRCAAAGDLECAFQGLDAVAASAQDADYHLVRSALLLAVGRVDEAGASIDRALGAGGDSEAHALRAVIGVATGNLDAAEAAADAAMAGTGAGPAAHIARSYVRQARLDLEGAAATLASAVERFPENALAFARHGELLLMLGADREALAAARRAVELAPDLSRARLVFGYAALARADIDTATETFERAIDLDSADPLPHLGLGLARVRVGELATGRESLEAAVAMDSRSALLRAYLGKAYFEERRGPLDAEQLAIARELDPHDPTAYLYDAIRLQSENRPVEALRAMQDSIERNDNRAVYRSKLALDRDRATRGASLARVYDDLGFAASGLNSATRSLAIDPSDAAAHRFLSDSYQSIRRREIARVSELLRAQMLQDVNISPVQPSLSATNLNTGTRGGPTDTGFNEFTSLFEHNGAQINATAQGGSNGLFAGEAVVSAIQGPLSVSGGAFHHETDGWRPNNHIEQDLYNVFAQVAVSPEINVQAEIGQRTSEEGDLSFDFDPDNFNPDRSVERKQNSARVGLRFTPNDRLNVLLSYVASDREVTLRDFQSHPEEFSTIDIHNAGDQHATQLEGQVIYRQPRFSIVAGAADADVRSNDDTRLDVTFEFPGFPPFIPAFTIVDTIRDIRRSELDHQRGYGYANVQLLDWITVTGGLGIDDLKEGPQDQQEVSPKIGVRAQVHPSVELRAAAFESVKPALATNRTLEPTQVAGFNQLFDDINGTRTTRYGVGAEWQVNSQLTIGGELTQRDLDEPVLLPDDSAVQFEDRDEEYHRGYVHWTPHERIAISAEVSADFYESGFAQDVDLPRKVDTVSAGASARYFHPGGFFASAGVTHVDQEVRRNRLSTKASGEEEFFVVDLGAGFRLPRRHGVLSLQVLNAFDERFRYQDDGYREFRDEPSIGPYFPERTFLLQGTISF